MDKISVFILSLRKKLGEKSYTKHFKAKSKNQKPTKKVNPKAIY